MNLVSLHLTVTASLLSWAFVVAYDPPHSEIYPQVQTAWPDRSVAIVCTTFGIFKPQIKWRKKGKNLWHPLEGENYEVTDNSKGSVLRILKMRITDYGIYECSAEGDYGERVKAKAEIKAPERGIYGPRHFPFTEGSNAGELIVKEGHTVHLKCYVYSRSIATVTWFKDMVPRDLKYLPRYYIADGGKSLEISDFKKEDAGAYQCMVISTDRFDEGTLFQDLGKLYLAEPIEIFPKDQTVANHGTALITCTINAKGNDWRIKWYKNGKSLKSERYHVIDFDRGSTLRIEPVSAARDEAAYECIAENGAGKVEKRYAHLTVQKEPLPDGFPRFVQQPNNKTTDEYEITMTCDAVGSPRPEIIWFKDNAPVDASDHPFTEDPNSNNIYWFRRYKTYRNNRDLKKYDVVKSDEGAYECMAMNSHGSVISDKGYLHVTE